MRARSRFAPAALALVCACSFEAKCGGGFSLDKAEVETSIREEFARIGAPLERAECPDKLPAGKDAVFSCTAFFEDSGGLSIPVEVTQPAPGRLEFEHQTIVPSDKAEKLVEDHLVKTAGHETEVDCGVRVRLPVEGGTFDCTFAYGDDTYPVEITFKDDDGNVSSQIRAVFSEEIEGALPATLPPGGPNPDGMKVDCGPRLHPLVIPSTFPCRLQFSDGSRWVATVAIEISDRSPFSFRVVQVDPA